LGATSGVQANPTPRPEFGLQQFGATPGVAAYTPSYSDFSIGPSTYLPREERFNSATFVPDIGQKMEELNVEIRSLESSIESLDEQIFQEHKTIQALYRGYGVDINYVAYDTRYQDAIPYLDFDAKIEPGYSYDKALVFQNVNKPNSQKFLNACKNLVDHSKKKEDLKSELEKKMDEKEVLPNVPIPSSDELSNIEGEIDVLNAKIAQDERHIEEKDGKIQTLQGEMREHESYLDSFYSYLPVSSSSAKKRNESQVRIAAITNEIGLLKDQIGERNNDRAAKQRNIKELQGRAADVKQSRLSQSVDEQMKRAEASQFGALQLEEQQNQEDLDTLANPSAFKNDGPTASLAFIQQKLKTGLRKSAESSAAKAKAAEEKAKAAEESARIAQGAVKASKTKRRNQQLGSKFSDPLGTNAKALVPTGPPDTFTPTLGDQFSLTNTGSDWSKHFTYGDVVPPSAAAVIRGKKTARNARSAAANYNESTPRNEKPTSQFPTPTAPPKKSVYDPLLFLLATIVSGSVGVVAIKQLGKRLKVLTNLHSALETKYNEALLANQQKVEGLLSEIESVNQKFEMQMGADHAEKEALKREIMKTHRELMDSISREQEIGRRLQETKETLGVKIALQQKENQDLTGRNRKLSSALRQGKVREDILSNTLGESKELLEKFKEAVFENEKEQMKQMQKGKELNKKLSENNTRLLGVISQQEASLSSAKTKFEEVLRLLAEEKLNLKREYESYTERIADLRREKDEVIVSLSDKLKEEIRLTGNLHLTMVHQQEREVENLDTIKKLRSSLRDLQSTSEEKDDGIEHLLLMRKKLEASLALQEGRVQKLEAELVDIKAQYQQVTTEKSKLVAALSASKSSQGEKVFQQVPLTSASANTSSPVSSVPPESDLTLGKAQKFPSAFGSALSSKKKGSLKDDTKIMVTLSKEIYELILAYDQTGEEPPDGASIPLAEIKELITEDGFLNKDILSWWGFHYFNKKHLKELLKEIDNLQKISSANKPHVARLIDELKKLLPRLQVLLARLPDEPTLKEAWIRTKSQFPLDENGDLYEHPSNTGKFAGKNKQVFDLIDEAFAEADADAEHIDEHIGFIKYCIDKFIQYESNELLNNFKEGDKHFQDFTWFNTSLIGLFHMLRPYTTYFPEEDQDFKPSEGGRKVTRRRKYKRRSTRRERRPRMGWTRRRQ